MIGASLAPALLAAFFWKRVTQAGGVAAIAAGMLTVLAISALNAVYRDSAEPLQVLGLSFPMNMDYIAIPAVTVSVATLVLVSLATPRPDPGEWRDGIATPPGLAASTDQMCRIANSSQPSSATHCFAF